MVRDRDEWTQPLGWCFRSPEIARSVPGAHIALLDPFLRGRRGGRGVIAELRELFAELVPFAYVLGEPARFPDGERTSRPQPVSVFRRITHTPAPQPSPSRSAGHLARTPRSRTCHFLTTTRSSPASGRRCRAMLARLGCWGRTQVLGTFGFGTSAA